MGNPIIKKTCPECKGLGIIYVQQGESLTPNVYCNCEQVSRDYNKLKRAGNELVFACLRVLISYDGVHRLWKAIGKWSEVCANEGNRK